MKTEKSISKKNNTLFPVIVTTIVVICVFIASIVYYYAHTIINDGQIGEINPTHIVYDVENINIENDFINIQGWCFRQNEDTSNTDKLPHFRLILAEIDNYDNLHYFSGEYGIEKPEVGKYYNDDKHNYSNCGFDITIDTQQLNDQKDFELMIQQNERNSDVVRPGIFIHNNSVLYANPSVYTPLDVSETDLKDIIERSKLRIYRPDEGMYVYQDGWCLYYIAEEWFDFDEGWGSIGHNYFTTQLESLPEGRREVGCMCVNWDFAENEITTSMNTGKYRVAVVDIATEYPVSNISTGPWQYSEGYLWRNVFCPGLPDS